MSYKNKLNIIFFGEDSFSEVVLKSLLAAGHKIALVVYALGAGAKDKRLRATAAVNNLPYLGVINVDDDLLIDKVHNLKPDFLIAAHFSKIIKNELLTAAALGGLNLHPSLLPFYRGMSPQHWPIINGEDKTGVTVHFMAEKADSGAIVLQREIAIGPDMYVSDLQKEFLKEYMTVMTEALELIIGALKNGHKFIGRAQNENAGLYFGRLREEQCRIIINQGVQRAYNLIRGVSLPYQGARFYRGGREFVIWRAEISDRPAETPPGEVVEKSGRHYLSFPDGALRLIKHSEREIGA